jgi:hypothetical protein
MAFPGTYDFRYYRGDTFEFIIRPKDSGGAPFPLDGYTAIFTIANIRGTAVAPATREAYIGSTSINTQEDFIICRITSSIGRNLRPGVPWVYDVEIDNTSSKFTLLNGNINVTNDITGAV